MIYQLGFFSDIGFSIRQALRTLCGQLAAILYNFIIDLYNVFMIVARAEILDNKYIQAIYNRVGMILGLFMLFKLVFSLIQSLVDPNKFTDEKKGFAGIIKRVVIAIVLLGITPSLFDLAFDVQKMIVGTENSSNNIIYKFIIADAEYEDTASFGNTIASDIYFSFYKENEPLKLMEGVEIEYPDGEATIKVINYDYLKTSIKNGTLDFYDTVDYLSLTNGGIYVIDWNEIFSIGMALVIIWLLISYTIQVATRVVQLAYLQLVAPVPILSYISDPDGAFQKWIKQCTTTYLDLFLRLAIIYFIIALSGQILNIFSDVGGKLEESTGLKPGDSEVIWVKLFLIIGLLMFGKKVPELLKDLFPASGGGFDFGLKSPKKLLNDIPGYGFAKGAATFGAGMAVGGIAGMASGVRNGRGVRGKIAGAFGGLTHGIGSAKTKGNIFKNAQAGMSATRQARQKALDRQIYKIDNDKLTKEYQRNEDILAAKKAIDDRAEAELLKTNRHAQMQKLRLEYLEANIGKADSTGHIITEADVITQRGRYKAFMDGRKAAWVNANTTDKEIAKQMQIIQNKTGNAINNYADVDREGSTAKTNNATNARKIQENEDRKQKIQDKKNKIK